MISISPPSPADPFFPAAAPFLKDAPVPLALPLPLVLPLVDPAALEVPGLEAPVPVPVPVPVPEPELVPVPETELEVPLPEAPEEALVLPLPLPLRLIRARETGALSFAHCSDKPILSVGHSGRGHNPVTRSEEAGEARRGTYGRARLGSTESRRTLELPLIDSQSMLSSTLAYG